MLGIPFRVVCSAFQEGTIPKHIEGDTSNVIFIKTQFSAGSREFYKFESALERGYFLALEGTDNYRTVLVVKKVELADEVDESTKLYHASLWQGNPRKKEKTRLQVVEKAQILKEWLI